MVTTRQRVAENTRDLPGLIAQSFASMERTLESQQRGPRGRVVSTGTVVATWEDRPVLFDAAMTRILAEAYLARNIDIDFLRILIQAYDQTLADKRLIPAISTDEQGHAIIELVRRRAR
jgi:hypothetical protein